MTRKSQQFRTDVSEDVVLNQEILKTQYNGQEEPQGYGLILPDIYITPLKPKINDCVKINNTAEAVGITWYSTQMTIREIKEYAREQMRYSL